MTTPSAAASAGPSSPTSDRGDRALVRHLLTLTPTERLLTLSSFWPVVRVGLARRHAAGGVQRP